MKYRIKVDLKEKSTYRFRVIRLITLPDDTKCWVLTHDGEDRYLLPAAHYVDYGIAEGMALRCRVDKINCTGRIFLEPEHPHYLEGEQYTFTFLGGELQRDRLGNALRNLIFRGNHGETLECITMMDTIPFREGDFVEVRVNRIKKGKVEIEPVFPMAQEMIHEGGNYPFLVTEVREDGTISIQGPGKITAMLNADYYRHHGLVPGVQFTGTILKWTADGLPLIEPEHPYYKRGGVYLFPVLREELAEHQFEKAQRVLIVEDCFGQEIKVFPGEDAAGELPAAVRCRVERLKKGRPVVRIS
ncbi:MAG: hypothetical protein R6V49_11045 [Bacteroidales bacterium]